MHVEISEEYKKVMTDEEFEAYMNRSVEELDIGEIRKHWDNTGRVKKEKVGETRITLLLFQGYELMS